MALITYLDKDKDIPDTEPRGQWRAIDANEVKAVVNANQNALPATIQAAIDAVVAGAPGALNTLLELSAAMGNDPNFSTTIINALALKAPLASPTFTGTPSLPTGATGVTQSNGDNSTKLATTAYADGKVADEISNAVTNIAPSQNAVFDALAGKQSTLVSGTTIKQVNGVSILGSGNIILIEDAIVDGEARAPSQNAVFDALALKATIQYVDDTVAGLGVAFKTIPAAVATTANITLSGEQTIDGVLTSTSRVLVKNQNSATQNGIYVSAAGSWSRSTDADEDAELEGAAINVTGGGQAGSNWWQVTRNVTLGGSDLVWVPLGQTIADASPTTKGVLRLYIVTGSNTDGTMDQNSITQALALKAPVNSPTFTGTVSGISTAMVGLGNVNNTADADKPVSAAQQTALNLKANINSPTFTGTVSGITKAMVGLSNVDNTTDLEKPISNATQTALNLKATATNFAKGIEPVGAINGVNTVFTLTQTIVTGSEDVFLSGQRMVDGIDYGMTYPGGVPTITFLIPPAEDDNIRVNYIRP